MSSRARLLPIFSIAAAFIGYNVGASNSTGQESLQFVAGYGLNGLLGAVLMVVLFSTFTIITVRDAQKYRITSVSALFQHYTGKIIGKALTIYTSLFIVGHLSVLISGCGAVFEEYLGMSNLAGRLFMAIGAVVLVMFGLKLVTRVGGAISVLIIAGLFVIPIINLVTCADGLVEGSRIMQSLDIIRAADSWWMAALMYFSWAILLAVAYVATLATNDTGCSRVELNLGIIGGCIALCLILLAPNAAMIANASVIGDSQIPNVMLAMRIHPAMGTFFSIVIVVAIFTSMAPETYSVCSMIVNEKSKYFKPLVVGVVLIAFVGSSLGSFAQIVNILTSVSAYVGFIYVAAVLITKFIRRPPLPEQEAGLSGPAAGQG